jgi:hypothetical protein
MKRLKIQRNKFDINLVENGVLLDKYYQYQELIAERM